MGIRAGFLLVAGLDPAEVVARLGMRLGEAVDEPDLVPALGPTLDGWTLIVDQPLQLLVDDETAIARLGRGTTLISLVVNETVMYSDAAGYENGQERWWVASGGDQRDWRLAWPRPEAGRWRRLFGQPPGPSKLQVRGQPPGDLAALLDAALRREAAEPVDHQFDIPSAVVAAATGGAFTGWPLDEAWTFRELER
jgi:hypothetical protein